MDRKASRLRVPGQRRDRRGRRGEAAEPIGAASGLRPPARRRQQGLVAAVVVVLSRADR